MNPTRFKKDEIIILLGAGASVEANIPASQGMIQKIENLLGDNAEWNHYRDLYNYIKSSIYFADGIKGRFDGATYNVETLVNTLYELRRWEDHPLYPFVGAWNAKLMEVSGSDLKKIDDFRKRIVYKLRDDWVQLAHDRDACYYQGLVDFQKSYNHPLRVFTLNYDLCVERACKGVSIERGFGEKDRWDWRQFSTGDGGPNQKDIYLYKLHGSVDWSRDSEGFLIYYDSPSMIDPDDMAIIFGVTYKLQYVDPFLFFAYELRRWTLDQAKLIVTVGYGFADEHINGILRQSLDNDPKRRLLVVSPSRESQDDADRFALEEKAKLAYYRKALGIKAEDQINWKPWGARTFFERHLNLAELEALFPEEDDLFEELPDAVKPIPVRSKPDNNRAGRNGRATKANRSSTKKSNKPKRPT